MLYPDETYKHYNLYMNTEAPLVSIIMPVYNGAGTIRLALASLLNQSYSNWECIIVNDGSTDNTLQIIKSLVDTRIKLIDLGKNYGRGYARNIAIKNCVGKYLCYLDADDCFHHDKLSKQVSVLENNTDIDLVGCGRIQFNDDLNPILMSSSICINKSYFKDGDCLPLVMPSIMIRREKSLSVEYDKRLDVGEDIDFISRYLDNSYYSNIADSLYYYRLSNLSRSKLIYYAKEDIRRGYVLFERNKLAGLKVMFKQFIKYVVYSLATICMPTDYFLKRRGITVSEDAIEEFQKEISTIQLK